MKKVLFVSFLFFLFSGNTAKATHIVGGNISVEWVKDSTFKLTLHFYRDCKDGAVELPNSVSIGFYDLWDDSFLKSYQVSLTKKQTLRLGDDCFEPENLCVEEGIYSRNIIINTHPHVKDKKGKMQGKVPGYYFSWQSCCRNHVIDNIVNPGSTGMTFYARVPDQGRKNSTPYFQEYPAAYFCLDTLMEIDFSAIETDGDSLVYSLVTPLNGFATSSTEVIKPGPYPNVTWKDPYNDTNVVGGWPRMEIDSKTGLITAQPSAQGVYVMSVMVEEYRNGTKIGEVRREVQFEVVKCEYQNKPPVTEIKPENMGPGSELSLTDSTIVIFPGDSTCFDVISTDSNKLDWVGIIASSPMFNNNDPNYPTAWFYPDSAKGQANAKLCVKSKCEHASDSLYPVSFLVKDSSQCVGYIPTITIDSLFIHVQMPPNKKPYFVLPALDSTIYNIEPGDSICTLIMAIDINTRDYIELSAVSEMLDHNLDSVPDGYFTIDTATQIIQQNFCFKATCEDIGGTYPINFYVRDSNACTGWLGDTARITYFIAVQPNGNSIPEITVNNSSSDSLTVTAGDSLCFNVLTKDKNHKDFVTLAASGSILDPLFNGPNAYFTNEDTLVEKISTNLCIAATCEDVGGSPYQLTFTSVDSTFCEGWQTVYATKTIDVWVVPDVNIAPEIDTTVADTIEIIGGSAKYCVDIKSKDKNTKDYVSLTAVSDMFNSALDVPQATFNPVGADTAKTLTTKKLCITTACDDIQKQPYAITFYSRDSTLCDGWQDSVVERTIYVKVKAKENILPKFYAPTKNFEEIIAGDSLCFTVLAADVNTGPADLLDLTIQTEESTKPTYPDISFTPVYGATGTIGSNCCIYTKCENVAADPYQLRFIVTDTNTCFKYDSVVYHNMAIRVSPPANAVPHFTLPLESQYEVIAGELFCFDVELTDSNATDEIELDATSILIDSPNGKPSLDFVPMTGNSSISEYVCIQTECQHSSNTPYRITFIGKDDACVAASTSQNLDIYVRSAMEENGDSLAPNIFTPNYDGVNDYFKLDYLGNSELYCFDSFIIQIYNRWGKLVFESNDHDFRWDGKDKNGQLLMDGTYFYMITSNTYSEEYIKQGFVHLMRGDVIAK